MCCNDKNLMEAMKEFKENIRKIVHLVNIRFLISWDMNTGIPEKAISSRIEDMGYIYSLIIDMILDPKTSDLIKYLDENKENLDFIDKRMVDEFKREYDSMVKIPPERLKEYQKLCAEAGVVWKSSKLKDDYNSFKPYLEKIFDFKKEFAEYTGYEGDIYNNLLDDYERGLTVEKLDEVFSVLRDGIVEILRKIRNSKVEVNDKFFKGYFSIKDQEEFGKFVLEKLGYDFRAGRLDTTEHPFTTNFGNKDVRITTHYYEDDFRSAFFSNIHEGGHGIYEQNSDDELEGTNLSGGASMGFHESQSRYYENILGRSKSFWTYFYKELQKRFPQFNQVTLDEFYKGINKVEPSFIRIDADELTYSLHVIIRYELEKEIINGRLSVDDLPKAWNTKYRDYLGVEPKSYREGVLQDSHWGSGLFGYFPSYALGNLYGAQILNKIKQDIPTYDDEVKKGNFKVITKWLNEHIHRYGKLYTPSELIVKVTGEELNPKYFLDYLNEKYSDIYELN